MTPSLATVDVEVGGEPTLMSRVAVIGDVGGYVRHLRHALEQLGVTDSVWPDDLHVIQVGDLFGGRADVEVAELVGPHPRAGRWTQLIGNRELEAVGGVAIGRAGRTVHPEAGCRVPTLAPRRTGPIRSIGDVIDRIGRGRDARRQSAGESESVFDQFVVGASSIRMSAAPQRRVSAQA